MDLSIKLSKQTKPSEKEQKEALLAVYRVVKPLERPLTPRTDEPDVEDEIEIAAMLLQRLLRGRAVQNMMFEGKERRLELIQELRAEEALGVEEARASGAEAVARRLATTMESLQGELVSKTLDYLSKELVRFKDERQIAEMVRQAEWTRRQREVRAAPTPHARRPRARRQRCWRREHAPPPPPPLLCSRRRRPSRAHACALALAPASPARAQAEESGRRQLEQLQRDEEERRWREAMGVHQATADTFLAEIVSDAVDVVAARQARVEMDAEREKHLVSGSNGQAKTIVLDLVSAFLFPEVRAEGDQTHRAPERATPGRARRSRLRAAACSPLRHRRAG
jgi:hypothetical protein